LDRPGKIAESRQCNVMVILRDNCAFAHYTVIGKADLAMF